MKRLIALALLVGLGAALYALPWWAGLALLAATPGVGWLLFRRIVTQFFLGAFETRSAVLAGASARIRSIEPAPPWKPEDDDDDEDRLADLEAPHHWVYVDLDLVAPENPETPMTFWDPGDLALVSEHAVPDDFESDEAVAQIYRIECLDGDDWVTVDGKLAGSQRLRLHAAARDGVDRFRIRYYFELIANAA